MVTVTCKWVEEEDWHTKESTTRQPMYMFITQVKDTTHAAKYEVASKNIFLTTSRNKQQTFVCAEQ
jgi:hypothetical protein